MLFLNESAALFSTYNCCFISFIKFICSLIVFWNLCISFWLSSKAFLNQNISFCDSLNLISYESRCLSFFELFSVLLSLTKFTKLTRCSIFGFTWKLRDINFITSKKSLGVMFSGNPSLLFPVIAYSNIVSALFLVSSNSISFFALWRKKSFESEGLNWGSFTFIGYLLLICAFIGSTCSTTLFNFFIISSGAAGGDNEEKELYENDIDLFGVSKSFHDAPWTDSSLPLISS